MVTIFQMFARCFRFTAGWLCQTTLCFRLGSIIKSGLPCYRSMYSCAKRIRLDVVDIDLGKLPWCRRACASWRPCIFRWVCLSDTRLMSLWVMTSQEENISQGKRMSRIPLWFLKIWRMSASFDNFSEKQNNRWIHVCRTNVIDGVPSYLKGTFCHYV